LDFEILQRQVLYQGRIFEVQRVSVRLPGGKDVHYDLIDHEDSVSLLPVDETGRIWFVRQYRLGAEGMLLELPAGVVNRGEEPEQCALRELREEIGMAAGRLQKLGGMYLAPGYSNEYMHVYLATELRSDPLGADEDEYLQVETLPVAQVYQMAAEGKINDSKTLAALLMAEPRLKAYR
jgi:ADP-ribose pyrophosphatase